jgi:predicted ATPase/class 3 adenylate cyclase
MSETRALLLTDVVDSTQLAATLGDAAMAALWAAHDQAARELLPMHGGREIDKTDGMLLLFEQADDALHFARAYHAALAALEPPLRARAGLHVGAVILRENPPPDVARGAKPLEVDGMAKPVAARVMALARGAQTLISADALAALGEAAGRFGALHDHGHWRLKGVPEPLALYELGAPPFVPLPDGDKGHRVARVGARWLPVRQLPNNLPQQATSFIGRERELDDVIESLRRARLVTLVGMGGLGKTRLALQVAAEVMADFPDGAWFLDLSPLREPTRVVEEAARLLQVQQEPGRPLLQTLCAHVRDQRLLLVVDNCEHLVEAAASLADALLRAAPGLRLIAASREALRVPGERAHALQPLPLPAAGSDAAVRLFVERAQAHRPDFQPGGADMPQVAELVTRLEGIPLALELAAARVRSLSVADINLRLQDRYRLLTGGSRVLQPRQQTLRALVDWSYDLLQPAEQVLFRRLGVFVGGFDLAAAEAVCGTDPLDAADMLDLVGSLVEKSLVSADPGGGDTRYRMLETLRDYAREKLAAAEDATATARRHAEHFWGVARQARAGLQGAAQASWVRRVEADLDNLRAATACARAGGADALLAAKLPVALQGFWLLRGRLAEGRELLRAALALPAVQASAMARAHTLYAGAVLADAQGDPVEAQRLLETGLALRREMQDIEGVAMTLSTLSVSWLATGRPDAALAAELEALQLFRQAGHRQGEAIGLQHLALIHLHQGRLAEALAFNGQALERAAASNFLEVRGECERIQAEIVHAAGDASAAQQHLQRALQLCREAGDRSGEARALGALGRHAVAQDELDAGRLQLGQALRAFQAFEMRADMIEGLEDHADLAEAFGAPGMAVTLHAAAEAARRGAGLVPARAARTQARLASLRQTLGSAAWEAAWAEGLAMSLQQALAAALALSPAAPSAA